MRGQQQRGQKKRQQVIDDPEGDERAENRRRGKERRQKKEADRFKDAQPTRHVADHAGDLRQEKDAQKMNERQRQRIREKDVENARGDDPVDRGDDHLGPEYAQRGQVELPLADLDRPPAHGDPGQIHDGRQQQKQSQNANGVKGKMNRGGNLRRRDDEERSPQQHEAEPEADGAESDDLGDFHRAQTPRGVQAVA